MSGTSNLPRQELTGEQIHKIAESTFRDYIEDRNDDADIAFARAIIAALATQHPK